MSRDFTTKPRPDQPGRCPSIDRDGDEAPCDEPATGWRWYQDVGEHEDLLAVACEFHRNEGGDRMHGLMQQAQTLRADLQHIAEMLGEDPDDVPEGHRLVDHLALRVGYLRGRDAGFDDVEAERDALAAQVARVEALAEDWRYKGQFGWGPWQIGEGPDPEGYVMDHCASALRAVWEAGDMGEESLGGDSESGTYNRSNRPPAGPRPDADNPWALLPDDHPERPKQCGGCGTKWVDAETAGACERRHGDDLATTPAPVGAAVAPNLDALHETICDKFTGMAEVRQSADLLVAEVRRLVKFRDWWKASSLANAEDVRRLAAICHDWRDRSEAAEAETVTLRARLAAVEALADQWADRKRSDGMSGNAWIGLTLSGVAADLRDALAGSEDDTTDTQPADQEDQS